MRGEPGYPCPCCLGGGYRECIGPAQGMKEGGGSRHPFFVWSREGELPVPGLLLEASPFADDGGCEAVAAICIRKYPSAAQAEFFRYQGGRRVQALFGFRFG